MVVIVLAAASGCGSLREPPPVAVEQQEWTAPDGTAGAQLLTGHFDMRLTIRDQPLRENLAPFMETAFAEYVRLAPPARDVSDRLVIYLFETREEWADFTRSQVPDLAHTLLHIQSGGYVDPRTLSAVAWDLLRDRTLSLLAHEGMHQYWARYFPEPIPAWLNEGLATQFEAFELKGNRPVFAPWRNFFRRNSLREAMTTEHGLIPLEELLSMHAGDAIVQTGQPTRIYYAQVWSMILFLGEGGRGKYAERFARLLADAGTNRLRLTVSAYRAATPGSEKLSNGEIIFRHYITEDLAAFTKDYREFVRELLS